MLLTVLFNHRNAMLAWHWMAVRPSVRYKPVFYLLISCPDLYHTGFPQLTLTYTTL